MKLLVAGARIAVIGFSVALAVAFVDKAIAGEVALGVIGAAAAIFNAYRVLEWRP